MDALPLSLLFITLLLLLGLSAFFSMSETAMMAVNRYRLKSRAAQGQRSARVAQRLLAQTDKLLGVILLGNSFINVLIAALATVICLRLFGHNEAALGVSTLLVTFAILVCAEATPKVIAAARPERIALLASYPLSILLRILYPLVWFINLFVRAALWCLRLRPTGEASVFTPEELRLLVRESGAFFAKKHQSMLLNLLELEKITVDDVMVPRQQVEMIDLSADIAEIEAQLRTCHHTRLPVFEASHDNVIGILHVRKVLHLLGEGLSVETLKGVLRSAYYVPESTPLFTLLQNFQEDHRRIGMVVDEYGELQGLVTLEDILAQVVGEFANVPAQRRPLQADGSLLVDGSELLRDLNRRYYTQFPLTGPKTVNGLIVEHFQDIPEVGTCFKLDGHVFEVLQTAERSVKRVRLTLAPAAEAA